MPAAGLAPPLTGNHPAPSRCHLPFPLFVPHRFKPDAVGADDHRVTIRRHPVTVRPRLLAAVTAGALAAGLGAYGGAVAANAMGAAPVRAPGPPAGRPPVSPPVPPSTPARGNLAVTVPATPPPGVIGRYCADYAAGRTPLPDRWLAGFTAETGGTPTASAAWCRSYGRQPGRPA